MAETAKQYLKKGRAALEARDYQEAHRFFSLAIFQIEEQKAELELSESEVAEAYVLRATALWREDEPAAYQDADIFHQVLNDLEQALDMQPRNAALLNLRGRLYLGATFEDHRTRAKADFEAALAILPEDVETLKNMAEVLMEQDENRLAADYLTKAIDQGQPDPELYLRRGVAFFKKAPPEYAAAAADFGQAEQLAPEVEETYLWRSQCFQEMGEIELAVEEYDKLIALAPQAGYLVDRGVVKLSLNEDAALEDFEKALEVAPHPLAYNNRAALLRLKGRHHEALADAQEALAIDPSYSVAHATLAEVYADMGDTEQMMHHLRLALEHYYDDVMEVMTEPVFEPYLQHTEFQALLDRY